MAQHSDPCKTDGLINVLYIFPSSLRGIRGRAISRDLLPSHLSPGYNVLLVSIYLLVALLAKYHYIRLLTY